MCLGSPRRLAAGRDTSGSLKENSQVSIGYCFEVAIAFLLASLLVVLRTYNGRDGPEPTTPVRDALERIVGAAFHAFFDCAIYFALAVELASVAMVVQKDWELSTRGFGADDARVALINSVVCVLPLLYYISLACGPGPSSAAAPPDPAGGSGRELELLPAGSNDSTLLEHRS